jgi:hypothetical protein
MLKFNFFSKYNAKHSINKELPDSKLLAIMKEIDELNSSKNSYILVNALRKKRSAFLREINSATDSKKRDKLILSYLNFTKAIESCLYDNKNVLKHLIKYYTSSDFQFIHSDNTFHNQADADVNSQMSNLSFYGAIFGMGALVLSSIALGVGCPVLGIIGLSLAFTVLIPSLFYLAAETLPKQMKSFKAEVEIFKTAVNIDLSQSELQDVNQEISELKDLNQEIIEDNTVMVP